MQPMLHIGVRAARAAGNVIARGFENRQDLIIEEKAENDFVTRIDREAESAVIETIKKSFPEHGFIAEESGVETTDSDFTWIIDPLDGTTNFVRGIPHFCVSIALIEKNRITQAVVYDPIRNDLFTASRGSGAQLNGYRMRVTDRKTLQDAVICTAFPFRHKDTYDTEIARFGRVFHQSGDVRRTGSAALDLAYVAAGKFDAYYENHLKPWDVAAGELLVRESGGLVTDYAGNNDPLFKPNGFQGEIVASNLKLMPTMLKALKA